MHRKLMRIMTSAVLLSMAASGCGGDATGPGTGNGNPAGIYTLHFVDDNVVPFMYDKGQGAAGEIRRYWISGKVTLKGDSTFQMSLTQRTTGPGYSGTPNTTNYSGTWRPEPGGIELTSTSGKAHWTTPDNFRYLHAPGTYTKISGGSASVVLRFGKG